MNRPLCFVLMPFGKEADAARSVVNFEAVYRDVVGPAIEAANLEPLRADEEMTRGLIRTPMSERLILCEYAIVDLTMANANVFYELGMRHAVRPRSTVLICAEGGRLPLNVAPLQALPYQLTPEGTPQDVPAVKMSLVNRLREAHNAATAHVQAATDSPIYQLIEDFRGIGHTKTDVFRDRVRYSPELKQRLAVARAQGVEALRGLEQELGSLNEIESAVVIDLLLSYRAVSGWGDMIALVDKMPRSLAATVMVQEQLAFALNRDGRGEEAERVLLDLLAQRGPSSETLGILGRVYKDRWEEACRRGDTLLAPGLLEKAIDAYLRGFEADWRDTYPGINAGNLMEFREPPDPRREKLLPVVTYGVERRIAMGKPDYWDHATRLELAVLAKNEPAARAALADALAAVRESWEPATTLRTLRLLREVRARRREAVPWVEQLEEALEQRARA